MTGILYTVIPVKTVINITVFMLKTVTIFGPSTGVKLEQITPGILKNTPVTRNSLQTVINNLELHEGQDGEIDGLGSKIGPKP